MRCPAVFFLLAAGHATLSNALKPDCPVYGPLFPTPRNLKNNPKTLAVLRDLDHTFKQTVEAEDRNFSIVFQAYATDEGVIWQQKFTNANLTAYLKDINSTGVKEVDENTLHRVGSITKAFTVLTFLKQVGQSVWFDPITKYIPELRQTEASNKGKSPIYNVNWDDITVGSLVTFQSGLQRDCKHIRWH